MPIQVNARIDEQAWEQVIAAMPGMGNGERMSRLVDQQLTLLAARRDLGRALETLELITEPVLQGLRRRRLEGGSSELVEEVARCATELAALVVSQTEALAKAPEKTLPELEEKLARRWVQTTLQLLRLSTLEPASLRKRHTVQPELNRILNESVLLSSKSNSPTS